MPGDEEAEDLIALTRSSFTVGHHTVVAVDAMGLLENFQTLAESLVRMKPALAVIPIDDDRFMQMVSLNDGGLRLESTASGAVLTANLGFSELVDGYPHIAASHIPAEWEGRELMAAETLLRVAIDIHHVSFLAILDVRVFLRQDLRGKRSWAARAPLPRPARIRSAVWPGRQGQPHMRATNRNHLVSTTARLPTQSSGTGRP